MKYTSVHIPFTHTDFSKVLVLKERFQLDWVLCIAFTTHPSISVSLFLETGVLLPLRDFLFRAKWCWRRCKFIDKIVIWCICLLFSMVLEEQLHINFISELMYRVKDSPLLDFLLYLGRYLIRACSWCQLEG